MLRLLQATDTEGNTVVLSLVRLGMANSLSKVLDCIEQSFVKDWAKEILQKTNTRNQNILHLAAISPAMVELYNVLQDYMHCMDTQDMLMSADIYNNTPLHYVAAKYDTKIFADFVLQLCLQSRHDIVRSRNMSSTDCNNILHRQAFSETYYFQSVLCQPFPQKYSNVFEFPARLLRIAGVDISHQLEHPEQYYKPNENILKVLKYALNEYSLLDSAYTTSHTLFSSALLTQLANLRAVDSNTQTFSAGTTTTTSSEKGETRRRKIPDSLCIYIDYDEVEEPKQGNIQKILNDTDRVELHGKPKIAVVEQRVSAESLNLVVPGPDYLILVVKYFTPEYKSREKADLNKYLSTDDLINELRCDKDVEKVCINSSFKRYLRDGKRVKTADTGLSSTDTGLSTCSTDTVPPLLITRKARGKALIICNQLNVKPETVKKISEVKELIKEKKRVGQEGNKQVLKELQTDLEILELELLTAKNRKEALENAQTVFGRLFGLQVEVKEDLTADGMKRSISEFSRLEGHGSLVALAIFSHGYKRKISGADSNSECSVQEVVDSLSGGNIDSIPKLLFLSFCQGEIPPQYNRAGYSFESSSEFPWPVNEIGMTLKPVRQMLTPERRDAEWKRAEFPCLNVPVDYYICCSTLPDSKSRQGFMFEMMVKHLSEISRSGGSTRNTAGATDDMSGEKKEIASTVTTCQSPSSVELVRLLTDIAGQVREKSQAKQYVNTHYTVNRDSRQIFIDIL